MLQSSTSCPTCSITLRSSDGGSSRDLICVTLARVMRSRQAMSVRPQRQTLRHPVHRHQPPDLGHGRHEAVVLQFVHHLGQILSACTWSSRALRMTPGLDRADQDGVVGALGLHAERSHCLGGEVFDVGGHDVHHQFPGGRGYHGVHLGHRAVGSRETVVH